MKIGFIGLGNMGTAILQAVSKQSKHELLLSNHNLQKAQQLQKQYGGQILSNAEVVGQADVLFLGVKPHLVEHLLVDVQSAIQNRPDLLWISMAAGVSIAQLAAHLPLQNIIRMMPNTPVAIGQGMTTFATENAENSLVFEDLMQASGHVKQVAEEVMDTATAIAGCGPAFVYEFIQALTTAGVQHGLSVTDAQELASQTVLGAAKMVIDSQQHPSQLRDQVTSPGGATIAGLVALTQAGFQAATIEAVQKALERTRELGR